MMATLDGDYRSPEVEEIFELFETFAVIIFNSIFRLPPTTFQVVAYLFWGKGRWGRSLGLSSSVVVADKSMNQWNIQNGFANFIEFLLGSCCSGIFGG